MTDFQNAATDQMHSQQHVLVEANENGLHNCDDNIDVDDTQLVDTQPIDSDEESGVSSSEESGDSQPLVMDDSFQSENVVKRKIDDFVQPLSWNKARVTVGDSAKIRRAFSKPYRVQKSEAQSDLRKTKSNGCRIQKTASSKFGPDFNPKDKLKKLVVFVYSVLGLSKVSEFDCYQDAEKVCKLVSTLTENHQLYHLLENFAHSHSCSVDNCSVNFCHMFKSLRKHINEAKHACALMQVYMQLSRLHVDSCLSDGCGLPCCKGMLATRQKMNTQTLPRNFRLTEVILGREMCALLGQESSRKFKNVESSEMESENQLADDEYDRDEECPLEIDEDEPSTSAMESTAMDLSLDKNRIADDTRSTGVAFG